ncbi:MAG: hypothetical protein APR63_02165 [Desulfuromonas sp. SDB]|nr:MAG: hypothetical protein APR63_02165 [Desulfuromonas sp. SDB]
MEIKVYPHPCLKTPASPVETVDENIRNIVQEMIPVMRELDGIGLAAPQVGLSLSLFIVEIPNKGIVAAINPEIVFSNEQLKVMEEGCLSIPGHYLPLIRPSKVKIQAVDLEGQKFEITGEDLIARAFLHEIDHLRGKLIIDHLSPEQRIEFERNLTL